MPAKETEEERANRLFRKDIPNMVLLTLLYFF